MHIKPALVTNINTADQAHTFLKPVSIDHPPYNEEWLQTLVQKNPDLIPAAEIEACFDTLVPVLMEYALPSGYLDNFFITPDGYPVLVEVKLWKNQESRRKVVAQILEYAKDFAAFTYEDLNAEFIKKHPTSNGQDNPLYQAVAAYAPETVDEITFVNTVSRNLREGRFLLLILGDGIRAELASLSEHLLHHSLHYAFGLVQVKLFELPDGNLMALPSVIAKTETIKRHITVIHTMGDNISVSEQPPAVISERTEKSSLSTEEFYSHLASVSPQAVAWLKDIIRHLEDVPVELSVGGDFATLIAPLSGGEDIILAKINLKGTAEFWGVPNKKRKLPAWRELSRTYLENIAALVPQSMVKAFDSGFMDLKGSDGKALPLDVFFGKEEQLVNAMRGVIRDAEIFFENTNI